MSVIYLKITHMWRRWARFRISFWHLLMNFEKPEKSDFWENEKNCRRYHNFTHVYQKPQSYEIKFPRYRVRQLFWQIIFPLLSPSPNNPDNQNFVKMKKASGDVDVTILNLCNKKQDQRVYPYSYMEYDTHTFLSF